MAAGGNLHDEVIVQAGERIEDQVEAIVKQGMDEALGRIIPEVPFVAKIGVADSWG
jgi:DNA polymerase I-like protein with 3'-5' exonuclease and polymerase domains